MKSPNPGGMSHDQELFGVSALSPRNAWAVGLYSDGSLNHALIEHWNGTSWKKVKGPDLGCTPGGMLSSVTAISPANVWAVGFVTNCLTLNATPDAFHWNGKAWREVAPPNPGGFLGGQLRSVDATSARNVWAVGDFPTGMAQGRETLIARWTGSKWKRVPSPTPTGASELNVLSGVAATSGSSAWAVGFSERFSPHSAVSVILRWHDHAWKRVPSPHPGKSKGDALVGVSALSASDAFAVGNFLDPVKAKSRTLAARWNGRSWKFVPSPTPPPPASNSGLNGVAATSARNAWAVGGYQSGGMLKILILRWNGKAWRRQV